MICEEKISIMIKKLRRKKGKRGGEKKKTEFVFNLVWLTHLVPLKINLFVGGK